MAVTVKIFTKAGGRPSLYATREFEALPISIGRDATCSMVLEDPHKHISRFHVELEEEEGTHWMRVVSKVNPVMVKGRRYGPGTRLTLQSGDSFEVGEYEVHLALAEPPPAPAPFHEPTFVAGEQAGAEPTYVPLPAQAKRLGLAASAPPPTPGAPHALRAFLDGAGLPHKDRSPAEAELMMRDGGAILRAAVEGLVMLLVARSETRKKLQAEERALLAARDNNPLKLMSDPREAMAFLFDAAHRSDGLLDPVQAIGDACEDLRAHEIALMAGMRAAILEALRRVDPHAQPEVFGQDFMDAYQAQLHRLRGGR